jgi:hypothetical protein
MLRSSAGGPIEDGLEDRRCGGKTRRCARTRKDKLSVGPLGNAHGLPVGCLRWSLHVRGLACAGECPRLARGIVTFLAGIERGPSNERETPIASSPSNGWGQINGTGLISATHYRATGSDEHTQMRPVPFSGPSFSGPSFSGPTPDGSCPTSPRAAPCRNSPRSCFRPPVRQNRFPQVRG